MDPSSERSGLIGIHDRAEIDHAAQFDDVGELAHPVGGALLGDLAGRKDLGTEMLAGACAKTAPEDHVFRVPPAIAPALRRLLQRARLAARSKFGDVAGFFTNPKGRIELQDHGARIWFRNIILRPLE